jgi:hypothetical protein
MPYISMANGMGMGIPLTSGRRLIDQMMAIAGSLWKCCALTCAQQGFAVVLDERQFALKDIDELVFVGMPVALAGPTAWVARSRQLPPPLTSWRGSSMRCSPKARPTPIKVSTTTSSATANECCTSWPSAPKSSV